jgi:hypothetical protein
MSRAVELMRIAAQMIEDNCPTATADYDGTTCDGFCLAEDLRAAAEDLEEKESRRG